MSWFSKLRFWSTMMTLITYIKSFMHSMVCSFRIEYSSVSLLEEYSSNQCFIYYLSRRFPCIPSTMRKIHFFGIFSLESLSLVRKFWENNKNLAAWRNTQTQDSQEEEINQNIINCTQSCPLFLSLFSACYAKWVKWQIRNKKRKIRKEVRRLELKKGLVLSPQKSKTFVPGNREGNWKTN